MPTLCTCVLNYAGTLQWAGGGGGVYLIKLMVKQTFTTPLTPIMPQVYMKHRQVLVFLFFFSNENSAAHVDVG